VSTDNVTDHSIIHRAFHSFSSRRW